MNGNNGAGPMPGNLGQNTASREATLFEVVTGLPIGHRARLELAELLKVQLNRDALRLQELDSQMSRLAFEQRGLGAVAPGTKVDMPNRVVSLDELSRRMMADEAPLKGAIVGGAGPGMRNPTPAEERIHEGLTRGRPPRVPEGAIREAVTRAMVGFQHRYSELMTNELQGAIVAEVLGVIRRD